MNYRGYNNLLDSELSSNVLYQKTNEGSFELCMALYPNFILFFKCDYLI